MMNNIRSAALILIFLCTAFALLAACEADMKKNNTVVVGSKTFTESVILGEIISQIAATQGADVRYRAELGGTRVLWNALTKGEIDIYPEYTGTIQEEILAGTSIEDFETLRRELEKRNILTSNPLGFNNTYILGISAENASKLGIQKISDLREHPDLRLGFSSEFMSRSDGWPSLSRRYDLPHRNVRGLDHDLAYRGLEAGSIDVIDLYATDAEIEYYDIQPLEDDLSHFPDYEAVILFRKGFALSNPDIKAAILSLEGNITESEMSAMNAQVKIEGADQGDVASRFLREKFALQTIPVKDTFWQRLLRNTYEHLFLVAVSLGAAIMLSIPLGIVAFRYKRIQQFVLGTVGIIQTVPSLALFVFMIPFFGIGTVPAICALFLYSLLPIVRNTFSGIADIPADIRESAEALGLTPFQRLRLVELPLATRSILSGIKISAVINVGTATLGALIGSGGYGQPILTGIRLDDIGLIMEGAIPAAVLALFVQGFFDLVEYFLIPRELKDATN